MDITLQHDEEQRCFAQGECYTVLFDKLLCKGTVKPVLSGHSKIDKTKVLETNCSFMKAESEHSAILLTCIKPY